MKSICIPIGEDCYSAKYLIKENKRSFSTIFDWIVIPPESIFKLFENDFKDFLIYDNLKIICNSKRKFKHAEIEIFDLCYNILIPHHFNNLEEDYLIIYNKFNDRINKLKKILIDNDNIFFYYKEIIENSVLFRNIDPKLKYKFGKNNMKIYEKKLQNIIKINYNCDISFIYL